MYKLQHFKFLHRQHVIKVYHVCVRNVQHEERGVRRGGGDPEGSFKTMGAL